MIDRLRLKWGVEGKIFFFQLKKKLISIQTPKKQTKVERNVARGGAIRLSPSDDRFVEIGAEKNERIKRRRNQRYLFIKLDSCDVVIGRVIVECGGLMLLLLLFGVGEDVDPDGLCGRGGRRRGRRRRRRRRRRDVGAAAGAADDAGARRLVAVVGRRRVLAALRRRRRHPDPPVRPVQVRTRFYLVLPCSCRDPIAQYLVLPIHSSRFILST